MGDYIDRHALKNDGHLCWHDGKGNVYYEVDHAPAADVEEVRHGKWGKQQFVGRSGFFSVKDFTCGECGENFEVGQGKGLMHYCPNCGAKMDGKGDGNANV